MPELNKYFKLEITPEQFLNACSSNELQETDLLLNRSEFQIKMGRNYRNSDNSDGPRPVLIPHDRPNSILNQMSIVFPQNKVEASNIIAKIVELVNLSPSDIITLMPEFQKLERLRIKSLVSSPQIIPEISDNFNNSD
ncbi:hypothetical protein ACI6PS_02415 [Flavobacterium sp. PLA-1-15]|uniref:hypothetical protein n=1 Tax=Flavobacterium sp. PLA-1-15 TaxID=3380533 RepID=UPI003B7F2AAF